MKPSWINCVLFLSLATLFSCKKDKVPTIQSPLPQAHIYHISFYDHKSGEKITGLDAELLYDNSEFRDYNKYNKTFKSDESGVISFDASRNTYIRHYIKISNQSYLDVFYNISEFIDPNAEPVHTMEGLGGPNVVNAKLLRREGNDFFFRADLYRKVPLDIHIVQVNNYPDTITLRFNAVINGKDPLNTYNIFGTKDLLGNGLVLSPGKKIDTTISVFAFGDYLNKISWTVYENVFTSFDDVGRRLFSEGYLDEKIFPSDIPSAITLTF